MSTIAGPETRSDQSAPRMAPKRWLTPAAVAVLVVALAFFPLVMSAFSTLQLTLVLVYAVAVLGLDVATGWTGQVSLGQSAFFGIGAYAAAICADRGWPLLVGLLLGIVVSGVVGALVAIPASRLHGYALGMVTLALPVIAVPLAKRFKDLTGGAQGINVGVAAPPEWTGLAPDQWRYYVVAVLAGMVFLLVASLRRSRFGRAFDSIRASEVLATSQGISVMRYKVLAFTICSVLGGIAGVMYLVAVQYISPETLVLTLSISLLASLAIGGLRSLTGCLLGAAFYVTVPNLVGSINPGTSYLFYGVSLLVVMLLLPGGIAPGVTQLLRYRRTAGTTTTSPTKEG
jgi:branched-chain amino acid transport system permease protein